MCANLAFTNDKTNRRTKIDNCDICRDIFKKYICRDLFKKQLNLQGRKTYLSLILKKFSLAIKLKTNCLFNRYLLALNHKTRQFT